MLCRNQVQDALSVERKDTGLCSGEVRKCCYLERAEKQAAGKEPLSHSSVTLQRTDFVCPDLQRAAQSSERAAWIA